MEMRINKTVNVEMDESLGYPMVFIKVDGLRNGSIMGAIKQEVLESLLPIIGSEQMSDICKECRMLLYWLNKGYLCYPAYKSCLASRPYNCGPKYIKTIDDILDKVNRHMGNEFLRMCEDLISQIADRLDAIAKNVAAAEPKKKAEQTVPLDASSEKLKKAVEKLNREDIFWTDGNVYFQVDYCCNQINPSMKALWAHNSGWNDLMIWSVVTSRLAHGEILLTLPKEMRKVQTKYWSILIDLIGKDAVEDAKVALDVLNNVLANDNIVQPAPVEAPTPQEGQNETAGEPKQSDTKAMLKAAVEKLGRKDVTYEYGHVYYQLKEWPRGRSMPMTNLWIRKTGLDTSTIQFRCTSPLMDGKVLLNLPPEIADSEDAYWAILDAFITPDAMKDIVDVQTAICKAMEEKPVPRSETSQDPLYFQTNSKPTSVFVEDMRFLWWGNVKGFNMNSVEEIVLKPLRKGEIYLLTDLPKVAAEFGPGYCEYLQDWLSPTEWENFKGVWNKIHPNVKI